MVGDPGDTSSDVSRNGVVVVCGGDVGFCLEEVDSRQVGFWWTGGVPTLVNVL
jgi:hypothetical protein